MRRGAAYAEARIARRLAREQDGRDPRSGMAMPRDKADRQFKADVPDQLRAAESACVHIAMGMACAAFLVDVFARKIIG